MPLYGPTNNVTWLSADGRGDGIFYITWAMPDGSKRVTNQMAQAPTLLYQTWEMLDREVEGLMDPYSSGHTKDYHKYRARAIAEVLAIFMTPHFTSADGIAREATRRYQAKVAGEEYETPGLGVRRYDPPPGVNKYANDEKPKPVKKAAASKRTGKSIPPGALDTAKRAVESGMFTLKQIADTYGVSQEEAKEQLGIA